MFSAVDPELPRSCVAAGVDSAAGFDPEGWRGGYPNPAFDNMRADDAFWGARLVAKFSDEAIRAIVAKARYSDAAASEYIAKTLIARRDKRTNHLRKGSFGPWMVTVTLDFMTQLLINLPTYAR